MSFSPREFRDAMGRFATGVTIVTGLAPDGSPVGVTVNSFSSVSLSPPLVLFSLDRGANSLEPFSGGRHFSVNVLREDQAALSQNFARQDDNKFDGIRWRPGNNGCPLFDGVLAVVECTTKATHDGGDHVIFVGHVDHVDLVEVGKPLLYYCGSYARLDVPLQQAGD